MPRDDGEDDLEKAGRYDVAVLLKALDVLEALSDTGDLGLADIAARTGASKASVFRVLATLVGRGYVTKDPGTRRYSPGPRLVTIALATTAKIRLVPRARPILAALRDAFGETANLGILIETEVVYLEIAESPQRVRIYVRRGDRLPAHGVAAGKAVLAYESPETVAHFLAQGLPTLTGKTITRATEFRNELAAVRRRGYAANLGEWVEEVTGVSAPVFGPDGRAMGAIGVAGPGTRMKAALVPEIGTVVRQAARRVSSLLGGRGPTEA